MNFNHVLFIFICDSSHIKYILKNNTLILGLGNDILSDDRIGHQLVRDLANHLNSDDLHLDVAASGGFEIVEYLKDFKKVIILDAIRTQTGKPGDIYCFIPSDFTDSRYLPSFHDIDFLTAMKLSNTLSSGLPEIHIIAIEILEGMVFSEELTPPMKERYGEILEKVTELIKGIIEINKN